MPSLKKMLVSYDFDLLGRICRFWGVDATNLDAASAAEKLHDAMNDFILRDDILESLPADARKAWKMLCENGNKLAWTNFSRKFGEIREFGPAKRERENPDQNPASTAEQLWYRGLIGRGFLDIPPEPREYAYIPDELHPAEKEAVLKDDSLTSTLLQLDPRKFKVHTGTDALLDHLTDWLVAKRMNTNLPAEAWKEWNLTEDFVYALAQEIDLLDSKGNPEPDKVKFFLQAKREIYLRSCFDSWLKSRKINDLKMMPGLACEGSWENDPTAARTVILEKLDSLFTKAWLDLSSFKLFFKENNPDFQRPVGDYDSWFIRDTSTNEYLRGFEHWDEVDGALIEFIITSPLHWLGMTDLALSVDNRRMVAFKMNDRFTFEAGELLKAIPEEPIKLTSELVFSIPNRASRVGRYQIGRFCEVLSVKADETRYYITPESLERASQQGLKPSQLVLFLEKNKLAPIPKSLLLLANQWESKGVECTIEKQVLLRVKNQAILQKLQSNERTAKLIVEVLTPTTAIIKKDGVNLIKKTLIELGVLTQIELDV